MNQERTPTASDESDTSEALQAAYDRLFAPLTGAEEADAYSLAQPYPFRYAPSVTTDSTDVTLAGH